MAKRRGSNAKREEPCVLHCTITPARDQTCSLNDEGGERNKGEDKKTQDTEASNKAKGSSGSEQVGDNREESW